MEEKQSNLFLKTLFSVIETPILISPLLEEGVAPFVLVNKSACDIYKYGYEELYQLTILDLIKESEWDNYKNNTNPQELKRLRKKQFETIHITKSGKEVIVNLDLTIINDDGKEMILMVVNNITEKRKYEQELIRTIEKANASSKMLETVLNNIPVRLFWKDTNLNYLGCNKLFSNDAGKKSPKEVVGMNDYEMPWKEQCELYRMDDKFVINNKKAKINYEELLKNSRGEYSWLRTSKIPLINDEGSVTGVLGVYEDITSKKLQELELESTQKELLRAQEIANLGNWVYEIESRLFRLSDELRQIIGFSKEEVIISFEKWQGLVFEDDKEQTFEIIRETIENQGNFDMNYRISIDNNKTIKWLNVKGEYVTDEEGKAFIKGIAQDVTKLTNTQKELEKHKRNLESLVQEKTEALERSHRNLMATNLEVLNKSHMLRGKNLELQNTLDKLNETKAQLIHSDKMASLGILTAGVSHELNNPLNFIQGGLLGLRTVLEEEKRTSEVNELLDAINTGVVRASEIITGLNLFNRTNDNYDEVCDIHAIIDNALVMLRNTLKHKISINKKYFSEPIKILGNIGKLHQVFVNLISNANQAIEKGGSIDILTKQSDNEIKITIEDTGSGIDKQSIQHIFDPFYTTKEPGEGIGLGLSISYTIIQEHKGIINLTSEKNKGTTVVITFPN